ncbi:MAG: type II toxin-antitoxin system PemK/MazF family toxin [Actinomycetota bacterium]
MTEAGDIHLADLNEERRRQVLVVSNHRFNLLSGRVLVAPEITGGPDEVPFPWRIAVADTVFAVDLLRSLPAGRLLDRTGRAPEAVMDAVRGAVLNIT